MENWLKAKEFKGDGRNENQLKIYTNVAFEISKRGYYIKKLGYSVDIQLNELNASISDEKAHVHVSIDADMSKEELMKILKKIGLN